ncbi:Transcriptional regulator, LysR family domain protein [Sulfitobacter noctilucae]|uniref:helix-turn-helix domain-containing protein n=1 Tax=Sulfitobacter noctilucae TaxID=1342302 RepID=UPI00046813A4|nr:LysR family transcriptional regulator [Sulfitobacter noctilucae]KIN65261.1 Transcriptional regulator, LysR family domain protein [Sulfitobacter noctilucae]
MNANPSFESGTTVPEASAPPALLFEMIRSFVTLASTLNLSHAVKVLGSTRQTVRRHILNLEVEMKGPLFFVEERRYVLTDLGKRVLPGAKDILARGEIWLGGGAGSVGALQFLKAHKGDWDFYQEQKPMGLIWQQEHLILREAFRAWTMAGGHIQSPHFAHIRPYLMIYRESGNKWICVEFGEKSAYVDWFGLDYARSSVGLAIGELPAGEAFGHMLNEAFFDVQATQLARLDHVFTRMPDEDGQGWAPMAYERLMISGFFPDGSLAVMTLVNPTASVQITGLPSEDLAALADLSIPALDLADAKFEALASGEGP